MLRSQNVLNKALGIVISFLVGRFYNCMPTSVEIDVGGIGYGVSISLSTYEQIKQKNEGKLYTHLHISDSAHVLYGFASTQEKYMFLQLISVSGVGPSIALAALSTYSAEELVDLIQTEQTSRIQQIKGIGKKTAQRLVLELSDKLAHSNIQSPRRGGATPSLQEEALQALLALGLSRAEAERNIAQARGQSESQSMSLEDLVKAALHASK